VGQRGFNSLGSPLGCAFLTTTINFQFLRMANTFLINLTEYQFFWRPAFCGGSYWSTLLINFPRHYVYNRNCTKELKLISPHDLRLFFAFYVGRQWVYRSFTLPLAVNLLYASSLLPPSARRTISQDELISLIRRDAWADLSEPTLQLYTSALLQCADACTKHD